MLARWKRRFADPHSVFLTCHQNPISCASKQGLGLVLLRGAAHGVPMASDNNVIEDPFQRHKAGPSWDFATNNEH